MYTGLHVKYLVFFSDFNETSRKIFKETQISNFMKIRPVGAEVFHADRRTSRHDEANNRFSQLRERA